MYSGVRPLADYMHQVGLMDEGYLERYAFLKFWTIPQIKLIILDI